MVRLEPSNPDRYKIRGDAYFSHQDYDHAIADFSESIRLKPTLAYCFSQRGWAYYWQKEYGRAISDFDKAIELDSTKAPTFNGRGRTYEALQEQPARPGRFCRGRKARAQRLLPIAAIAPESIERLRTTMRRWPIATNRLASSPRMPFCISIVPMFGNRSGISILQLPIIPNRFA